MKISPTYYRYSTTLLHANCNFHCNHIHLYNPNPSSDIRTCCCISLCSHKLLACMDLLHLYSVDAVYYMRSVACAHSHTSPPWYHLSLSAMRQESQPLRPHLLWSQTYLTVHNSLYSNHHASTRRFQYTQLLPQIRCTCKQWPPDPQHAQTYGSPLCKSLLLPRPNLLQQALHRVSSFPFLHCIVASSSSSHLLPYDWNPRLSHPSHKLSWHLSTVCLFYSFRMFELS